ncbi:hypothetical protein N9164_02560 [Draconibacterium sp.]|nr:hypothetical protein [Draconibacterium sp.]
MKIFLIVVLVLSFTGCEKQYDIFLTKNDFKHYIEKFNKQDQQELHVDVVPNTKMIRNSETWNFIEKNVPFFECPDKDIEEVYYYRWWTFRKHIKQTVEGYVITEFMPLVSWARKYNTIPCPAGHQFREGRWVKNQDIIKDYGLFWLRKGGDPYRYSFWISDSFLQFHYVHPNDSFLVGLLPDLINNFHEWERLRREPDGLFWQYAGHDGMECAIGGDGKRPTINTYMFAEARAIATIANIKGDKQIADKFSAESERIRELTLLKLWDDEANFFKVLTSVSSNKNNKIEKLCDARELLGYVPWYMELPPKNKDYELAWEQLMDKDGFYAPFGPTTAEQRHPGFEVSYEGHECQWNGPGWPFATSQTLTALANVLNDYPQDFITKDDFFETLKIYTRSHRFRQIPPDGKGDTIINDNLWIDENLNPYTGDWLARTRMEIQNHNHLFNERGIYYNHSTYNDIIITALAGLRPVLDNKLVVNPLIPDTWDWFCLDDVFYKGRKITILWDKTGAKYNKGKGLRVFVDGKQKAKAFKVKKLEVQLKNKNESNFNNL